MLITKTYTYDEINSIINKLDLLGRIYIGQYGEIVDYINWHVGGAEWYFIDKDYISSVLFETRNEFIPTLNSDSRWSLGIWNLETHQNAVKAYDIQQILRYQMSWHKHPEGGWTVNFDNPLIHGKYDSNYEERRVIEMESKHYLIKKFGYADLRRIWYEPIVISEFNDHDNTCEVKILKEAEDIIKLALEVAELVYNICIKEVFIKLYGEKAKDNAFLELAELCLKNEEMRKYCEKKEI